MSDGGKGSNRRPAQVPMEQVEANWDAIFKNKKVNEHLADSMETNVEIYKKLSRIDNIGQNGNDGLHYDSDDAVDRWSAVLRDEYDSKYWKDQ